MYYAQIDPESKICIAVHQMAEYHDDNYISIDFYNTNCLGMVWDGEKFIDNPNPPVVEPVEPEVVPPTDTELTIMEAIADNYEATQDVKESNIDIMSAIADLYEAATSNTTESEATSNG